MINLKKKQNNTIKSSKTKRISALFYLFLIVGVLINKITCDSEEQVNDPTALDNIAQDWIKTIKYLEQIKETIKRDSSEQEDNNNNMALNLKRSFYVFKDPNNKKSSNLTSQKIKTNKLINKNTKSTMSPSDLERHRNMLRVIFSYGR